MLVQWGQGRQRVWAELVKNGASTDPCTETASGGHWLVVVHGGAWRDEKVTHESAASIFASVDRTTLTGMASLDYRLSPGVQHPEHLNDVRQGIAELVTKFSPTAVTLVGHSCGAFLCGQVYADFANLVTGVVGVEGIYNLELLVEEYPAYEDFVAEAFGSNWPEIDWSSVPIRALVQSKEDELLSLVQTQWVAEQAHVEPVVLEKGHHDEVYEVSTEWIHLCTD